MMRKCDDKEEMKIDDEIINLMLSWCQDCRFVASLYVIESVHIDLVKELDACIASRLKDKSKNPTIEPVPEPRHKKGGCHAHC